jgi:hypothetical protein
VRALLLVGLLSAAGCATTSALQPVDPVEERGFYQAAVSQVRRGGGSIDPERLDYARLRLGAHFEREGTDLAGLAGKLVSARAAGDLARAAQAADELLESDFTDVEAHLEKARALHRGDPRRAAWHEALALNLLRSILSSGDLVNHPVRVFGPREEDAVAAFLDLRPTGRVPHQQGERRLEVLTCLDPAGRPVRPHFDVTPPKRKPPEPEPRPVASTP